MAKVERVSTHEERLDTAEATITSHENRLTPLEIVPAQARATGSGGSSGTSFASTGTGFSFTFRGYPVVIQYQLSGYIAASGITGDCCIFVNGSKVGSQSTNTAFNGATTGYYATYSGCHIVQPGDIANGTYTVAIAWRSNNGSFPIVGNEREIIAFELK